jgi:hypothetical protein
VDLPEAAAGELVDEFLDRLPDQGLDRGRLHPGVLFIADEEEHPSSIGIIWIPLADTGPGSVQVGRRIAGIHLRGELVQQPAGARLPQPTRRHRAGRALLDARLGEHPRAFAFGGLQDMIGHALLEGLDR